MTVMKTIEAVIRNSVGLHARPAALFVQTANKFSSRVTVNYESKSSNAKSILGLMSLGIGQGATISIVAEGEDEEIAINSLAHLIESDFAE